MANLDSGYDEQDQAELFDEDNTNPQERGPGEEAEQFEDLVDLYDATSAVGDADDDDDDAAIGDDLDDDEIVARARDEGDEEGLTLEPGDRLGRDPRSDINDVDPDEVELEYVGDLDNLADAGSAAQSFESDTLSDRDLRELDYKDEFTRDDDDLDAPPAP